MINYHPSDYEAEMRRMVLRTQCHFLRVIEELKTELNKIVSENRQLRAQVDRLNQAVTAAQPLTPDQERQDKAAA